MFRKYKKWLQRSHMNNTRISTREDRTPIRSRSQRLSNQFKHVAFEHPGGIRSSHSRTVVASARAILRQRYASKTLFDHIASHDDHLCAQDIVLNLLVLNPASSPCGAGMDKTWRDVGCPHPLSATLETSGVSLPVCSSTVAFDDAPNSLLT